jgi:aminoglycoside phosphotransferase (APT) family kinase protein
MVDGLDLDALSRYLAPWTGGRPASLTAQFVTGGKSNLTYRVTDGTNRWIVRRPPLGHVLATAHDMAREYRVMDALAATAVPVPGMVTLCEDDSIIGSSFYVMAEVDGDVLRDDHDLAGLSAVERTGLAHRLIDILGELHRVDPQQVGLGDFGRPEGFTERQVRRWTRQLEQSRSRDIPGIEQLAERLAADIPPSQRATIVHGDYRLDNLIVERGGTDVLAVIDWEMAALGDPLCDLGLLPVYADPVPEVIGLIEGGMGPHNGFPPMSELFDRYADQSGLDLSPLPWYIALGCYKLAVILEGVHYRYVHGQTVGSGFDRIGEAVAPLVAAGLARLA